MLQVGSRAILRCKTPEGHEALYDTCEIVNMSSKTIEVKYCAKVSFEGDRAVPVIRRDVINKSKIVYLQERC